MANVDVTRIAGGIGALSALTSLQSVSKQLAIHQARLASGKRINSAADDPAGLTIAYKMDSESQGLKTALGNISDAKNLLAVAESGVGKISDILVQMRNLALQGASDTMGTNERAAISTQLTAYAAQIDNLVANTKWNGTALIGTGTFTFQTGTDAADTVTTTATGDLGSTTLAVTPTGLTDNATFTAYADAVNSALDTVSTAMSGLGAAEGQLSFKEDQVANTQVNVEGAYSRIMNADMADEQVQASKLSILQQTATAMLAQSNSAPQFILTLFR